MEATITSIRFNPLMDRNEIEVNLEHEGEPTPSKEDVKNRVSAEEDIDPEEIEVQNVKTSFGRQNSTAYLKVREELDLEEYEDVVENEHVEQEDTAEKSESDASTGYDDIVSGTINEAKDQLKDIEDPDYEAALEAEKSNKNRKTLVSWLESRKE